MGVGGPLVTNPRLALVTPTDGQYVQALLVSSVMDKAIEKSPKNLYRSTFPCLNVNYSLNETYMPDPYIVL